MSAPAFSLSAWKARAAKEDLSGLDLLDEAAFLKVLQIEQKRTERSGRRFVLLLMHCADLFTSPNPKNALESLVNKLTATIRVTDITGWYKHGAHLGVIFTEIGAAEDHQVSQALHAKISTVLSSSLSAAQAEQVTLSLHIFPEAWDSNSNGPGSGKVVPADLRESQLPRKAALTAKRLVDIAGSLSALILLSPVMAAVALAVKLTSPGPVLFKQQRVGYLGRHFSFWKFRSMVCNNNSAVHEEFVKTLIAGGNTATRSQQNTQDCEGRYKLKNDLRITPIGRFIRRTSLDELPQFFNVLLGDMSLVGPRPPIPYEVKYYDIWHRRRVFDAKPGITGLWQVTGRSRVGFDDMVRLDLKYARSWSLWLDLKILLLTPRAVLGGEGAR